MQKNGDSFNRGGFYAFLFSMIFSIVFCLYIALVYPGINLREVPQEAVSGEEVIAGSEAPAAQKLAEIKNPWQTNDVLIDHGKEVFQKNCALCHGAEGKGDGPAGSALNPPPRNLVEGKWRQGGDAIALFKTIAGGVPNSSMAAFKHISVLDRWSLVHFIRSITQNKASTDDKKLEEFAKTAD